MIIGPDVSQTINTFLIIKHLLQSKLPQGALWNPRA